MKKKKAKSLTGEALIFAFGVLVYVSLVASLMYYGDQVFGRYSIVLGIVAVLLLFIVSAVIVGLLVLGKPLLLYLDKKKKEAIQLFSLTVFFVVIFLLIALFILIMFNTSACAGY